MKSERDMVRDDRTSEFAERVRVEDEQKLASGRGVEHDR